MRGYQLGEWIRICIGTSKETKLVLELLHRTRFLCGSYSAFIF